MIIAYNFTKFYYFRFFYYPFYFIFYIHPPLSRDSIYNSDSQYSLISYRFLPFFAFCASFLFFSSLI